MFFFKFELKNKSELITAKATWDSAWFLFYFFEHTVTQLVYPLIAGLRRVWQQPSGPVRRWLKIYGRSHRTSRALIWRWLLNLMICIEPKSIWRKDLWSSSGADILFNLNKIYWISSMTLESLNMDFVVWFVYFLGFVLDWSVCQYVCTFS